jgi:hypothetical protein
VLLASYRSCDNSCRPFYCPFYAIRTLLLPLDVVRLCPYTSFSAIRALLWPLAAVLLQSLRRPSKSYGPSDAIRAFLRSLRRRSCARTAPDAPTPPLAPLHLLWCRSCVPTAPRRPYTSSGTPTPPSAPFLRSYGLLTPFACPYTSFGAVPGLLRPLDAIRVPLHLLRCRSGILRPLDAPTPPSVPVLRSYGPSTPFACPYTSFGAVPGLLRPLNTISHAPTLLGPFAQWTVLTCNSFRVMSK